MAAFAARHPLWRSWLVLSVIALQVTVWTVVLAQPGPAPTWLLVVLVLTLATGGPGSMVGIDIGRTSNPVENAGLAQSLVNMGGFLATLLVLLSVGFVLSWAAGSPPSVPDGLDGAVPGLVRRRHGPGVGSAGSPVGWTPNAVSPRGRSARYWPCPSAADVPISGTRRYRDEPAGQTL